MKVYCVFSPTIFLISKPKAMKKNLLILACISICALSCKQKTTLQDTQEPMEIDFTDMQICQSCCMPMTADLYGTNANGMPNEDYCKYCYVNGAFTTPDLTMERMIEICVPYMVEQGLEEESARNLLKVSLPKLKRWQSQK
jgi:hypothetical protein